MTTSATQRVLEAFKSGEELTSKQIASRFNVANPTATVSTLRMQGYPIYLNKSGKTSRYRLGSASRKVIAAGYKALAAGLV
jgi:Mn-dependent DtxR family transcriptional regulator